MKPELIWHRARAAGNAAIEVARHGDHYVIRNPAQPEVMLAFTPAEWEAFLNGAKGTDFDKMT